MHVTRVISVILTVSTQVGIRIGKEIIKFSSLIQRELRIRSHDMVHVSELYGAQLDKAFSQYPVLPNLSVS